MKDIGEWQKAKKKKTNLKNEQDEYQSIEIWK